jgi:hypothetical protein
MDGGRCSRWVGGAIKNRAFWNEGQFRGNNVFSFLAVGRRWLHRERNEVFWFKGHLVTSRDLHNIPFIFDSDDRTDFAVEGYLFCKSLNAHLQGARS